MNHRIVFPLTLWLFLLPVLFSLGCDDGLSGCINNQMRCEGNELLLCEKSEWVLLTDCTQSGSVCQAGQCVNPDDTPDGDADGDEDGDTEEETDSEAQADGDEEQADEEAAEGSEQEDETDD